MATPGAGRALLNHFIRPKQDRLRDRQVERFGGLEIDDEIEFRRLLDRQVAGLGAFEYLVHVGSAAPKQIGSVRSIGHEAPSLDILSESVHSRQPVLCSQIYETSFLTLEHGA